MTSQHRFKVAKLVRDKLPSIMRSNGMVVIERTLDQDEYIKRLKDKILEEVQEVTDATTPEQIQEELADLLEVIQALSQAHQLSLEDIESIRLQKKTEKGGFGAKVYINYVEMDSANSSIGYYLARPDHYPEIK